MRSLDDALTGEGSVFYCVSESGAELAPLPSELVGYAERFIMPDKPLSLFEPTSYGLLGLSFSSAVGDGYGKTLVQLIEGGTRLVEMFSCIDELGCVVVSLGETDEMLDVESTPELELPVRRMTSRMDESGRCIEVDEAVTRLLGWTQDEFKTLSSLSTIHPDDAQRAITSFAELLGRPGGQKRARLRVRHRDESWRWFEITHTNLLHTSEPHILAESYDISDEMQVTLELEEREAVLALLTESLPVGVLHVRPSGEPDISNSSWARLTGTDPGSGLECFLDQVDDANTLRDALASARATGVGTDESVTFAAEVGGCRHADLAIRALPGEAAPYALLLTLTDTSESVSAQAQLLEQAHHDHLTGVLNRLGVERRISELLSEEAVPRITVLYCDLNNFKVINDTYGHAAGDAVLVAVAAAVRQLLRPIDLVARLGGDEFLVVLHDLPQPEANRVATGIKQRLRQLTDLDGFDGGISVSIGVVDELPGDTFETLVRRADAAMYQAKADDAEQQSLRMHDV